MATPMTARKFGLRLRRSLNLKRCREAAGLTAKQAAERYREMFDAPMTEQTISRYENAHNAPTDEKLLRFAEIYGVDYSEFTLPLPEESDS
jgi:transcriptional regulator with XRE-family HTH domain